MKCPYCNYDESKVTDSRNCLEGAAIRRRRECLKCQKRFTTFETIDLTTQVKKRDGSYEEFQIDKLIRGLDAACRHTRISHDRVRALAAEIMAEVQERQEREITTLAIGELAMEKLKKLDTVAYIRFACVYRRFKDKDEIIHAMDGATQVRGE
ncbi:MAG: transcriptional regulator NrdR [Chlamydiae bacterium RIFCSPHIGHO2_12_FULL_49_11]|nr:MAG: transcriptional regulator NrdR [Chlamydiae bacterium RIFCSPHIGHO2_12_FULL_49_11]